MKRARRITLQLDVELGQRLDRARKMGEVAGALPALSAVARAVMIGGLDAIEAALGDRSVRDTSKVVA